MNSNVRLTIQHNGVVFEPPIMSGVKIEWERLGTPGKLTFTTVKIRNAGMSFSEGDAVCFYYKETPMFMGYVFKKRRSKEHHIEVTCYDQIRYLKNKYTYAFENKTANQIIKALCADFNIHTGSMDDTGYIIKSIVEENKAAIDIALTALDETLVNTGEMFVLFDDFGDLCLKNCANMISRTLICEETAEDFDYTSSIDEETYNQIILYYKDKDNKKIQLWSASSEDRIKQWGTLRYFKEIKTPTIGQNIANGMLKLYNRKTRSLTVKGAFGSPDVRGGTLIPTKLYLGDTDVSNFLLVEKVTHNFDENHYTMDLTLDGGWED